MLLGVAILSGNCHPLCVTGHYRIVLTHNAQSRLYRFSRQYRFCAFHLCAHKAVKSPNDTVSGLLPVDIRVESTCYVARSLRHTETHRMVPVPCRLHDFRQRNMPKNHENRHFHVSDFKYRCCAPPKSSSTVKIHLSSKFQPLKSSEQETPAVHKQTNKQIDRRNFLRHQEKSGPITWNCHRGKPAGGSSKM